jgi:starch synthase
MPKILHVAAEGLPFVKTGGLADVIGSLPQILKAKGHDVRVVLPLYLKMLDQVKPIAQHLITFKVEAGGMSTVASIFTLEQDEIIYYFVQHQGYFERQNLYGYGDDGARFGFFQRVVMDMLQLIDFQPDIIHCHDWHTGMIPFLGKTQYGDKYRHLRYVFTIHNLAYQGIFPTEVLWSCLGVTMEYYHRGDLRFDDSVNFVKAAIVFADKITTVSPTYAKEILTPAYGERLDGVLRSRAKDLIGIVNGIDDVFWDPSSDKALVKNYNWSNIEDKVANKLALQEQLGLRVSKDVLVIGMVSRLTWQKGVYLMIEKINQMLANDIQLVILGNGELYAENQFKKMEADFRRRAVFYCGYNENLAHLVYAGSDVFLMPSLFEPCGISQLIAMRYGTLPIVRETGGLQDTVVPYNQFTKQGSGFSFTHYNSEDLLHVINMVVDLYYQHPKDFKTLIGQAMKKDVSWQISCLAYEDLYLSLVK